MDKDTIIDVVDKLIGDVFPKGESYNDEKALNNLKTMIDVCNHLVDVIADVEYKTSDRVEFSMKICGQEAKKFLDMISQNNCPKCNNY